MILSKDVKIKRTEDFTSEYIKAELKKQGYDVLRWAVTDYNDTDYIVNIAYVED